ncbi:solute carrier family 13 member 2-like [Antennarius striatus]|uniref:solute carrier family 13 member 2-like n=1 Tax=Antennarius striatus TaxID=241820 RepID=UPI0035B180F8
MALFWCTECLPLAVTGLLPIILFPMMGIMKAEEVSIHYMKDSNMLFLGGLFVAVAVETWDLHKRIALRVLLLIGVRPSLLLMGFMMTSAFLSMWISNTATTAMMLPISKAVLQQLETIDAQADAREVQAAGGDENGIELEMKENKEEVIEEKQPDTQTQLEDRVYEHEYNPESSEEFRRAARQAHYERLTKGMSLSVCYSASIGGTATLTGTIPNLILKGQVDQLFSQNGDVINFVSWFGFAFPNMVIMLFLTGIWIHFMFLGFNLKRSFSCGNKTDRDKEVYTVLRTEYNSLGRMTFAEVSVLIIFIVMVLLWFTREPGFIDGWATVLFNQNGTYVSDGTVAVFIAVLFFIIPSRLPKCGSYGCNDEGKELKAPKTLLSWKVIHERIPWNILLLLGGGYALAEASEESGLSKWLGGTLSPLKTIPPFCIALVLSLLVATFTECSSNSTTTTLFLPILASLATSIKLHPLYLMLPCTIAASLAFMLPVATPPNAIAFSFANLKVMDMVKTGFILNIIGILTTNVCINTWAYLMFDLGTFPHWANVTTDQP